MSQDPTCRCPWLDTSKPDYVDYHDNEWGIPVFDDQKLFENLILESAQAGLSWYTILKRRDGYQKAFKNFNVEKVALFTQQDIDDLVQNPEIIRHRGKIEATVNNAKCFLAIQSEYGSFSQYLWKYVNNKTIVNNWKNNNDYPATTKISDQLSKDLKKKGFKFVGSTICYAYMQACGLVNDHSIDCYKQSQIIQQFNQLEA